MPKAAATRERIPEEYRAIDAFLGAIREAGDTPVRQKLLAIMFDTLDYFDALRDHATV